eukprot:1157143-Pelagomonas_calceolata.AAC.4
MLGLQLPGVAPCILYTEAHCRHHLLRQCYCSFLGALVPVAAIMASASGYYKRLSRLPLWHSLPACHLY